MAEVARIMVATDLSSGAAQALDRGFLLARASGARFTVVHAVGIDALMPLRQFLGEDAAAVAEKVVEEAAARLKELAADSPVKDGVAVDLRVERGFPGTVIPAIAETEAVDLTLVGAHGSGFLQRMLLGSTASRLLRTSRCPVLVVKQEAHRAYRRVLIAVDFSPGSEKAVRLSRAIAPDAELLLLHVFDVPFEGTMHYAGVSDDVVQRYRTEARAGATRQVHAFAQQCGLSTEDYSAIVAKGDATRGIIELEERRRCDLIVMGKHGTHVTEELLLGSVTKRVLAESRGDVLVVVDSGQPRTARLTP